MSMLKAQNNVFSEGVEKTLSKTRKERVHAERRKQDFRSASHAAFTFDTVFEEN